MAVSSGGKKIYWNFLLSFSRYLAPILSDTDLSLLTQVSFTPKEVLDQPYALWNIRFFIRNLLKLKKVKKLWHILDSYGTAQATTDIIKSHFTEAEGKQNCRGAFFSMARSSSYSPFLSGLQRIPSIAPVYVWAEPLTKLSWHSTLLFKLPPLDFSPGLCQQHIFCKGPKASFERKHLFQVI